MIYLKIAPPTKSVTKCPHLLFIVFDADFFYLASGGMNAKLTGDFPDLMQSDSSLTYDPTAAGDAEKLKESSPCPNSIGICKHRIGK